MERLAKEQAERSYLRFLIQKMRARPCQELPAYISIQQPFHFIQPLAILGQILRAKSTH
jgi:hypothetical protein